MCADTSGLLAPRIIVPDSADVRLGSDLIAAPTPQTCYLVIDPEEQDLIVLPVPAIDIDASVVSWSAGVLPLPLPSRVDARALAAWFNEEAAAATLRRIWSDERPWDVSAGISGAETAAAVAALRAGNARSPFLNGATRVDGGAQAGPR